jgi:5-methylcytosine-specific restriction endonuclease McrA
MPKKRKYPKEFIEKLNSIKAKRPKTVIQHILKHGSITTEELLTKYGYEHAPRAARDVRELGIPLETTRVRNSEGRFIAKYRFGDLSKVRRDKLAGRKIISREFKKRLVDLNGARCHICLERFEERYLQVDHCIPYEVAGDEDPQKRNVAEYMLLCGSCNRAKSWSCEHCPNWQEDKESKICRSCYWASPQSYKHIALREERRLDIVWQGDEIDTYKRLQKKVRKLNIELPDFVKSIIDKQIKNNSH